MKEVGEESEIGKKGTEGIGHRDDWSSQSNGDQKGQKTRMEQEWAI